MNNFGPKTSISEEMFTPMPLTRDFRHDDDLNVPREVFRNKTTSVEVIVKQVANKNNKKDHLREAATGSKASDLYTEIEFLKNELLKANTNLAENRKCFNTLLCEIKRQLDEANQRELRRQTKNLLLQLEKEKLKTLLESKSNLVRKLKKELLCMRRIIKFVIKGMHCVPDNNMFEDDADEYSEFEKYLKRSASSEHANVNCLTLDSIISGKM